eukprot:CAMPEP_0113653564 /NCGR_PEP_ID=MMETSP0017_2-20120614/28653_1 /TAXON_ID=2856 /ORGANISM="Cylindrotheca closterium" /LENGTH=483 /DNA_ID=CAMNT_0000566579 /DNA_START=29 /DNA_END=1481 /DNA_ORIENTATION=- /assembly_acc=CAM_ASM_000147
MGCVNSRVKDGVLENPDGDKVDYDERFEEIRVLGEGSFGVVSLVNDKKSDGLLRQYACKLLKKGEVWKGDTLYPPIPPEVLRTEVEILRSLRGQHFCLKLIGGDKELLLVSECCSGGEMVEYVSMLAEDLRTEDISRISYQLLDAVDHCQRHNVIHRDLKPENIMFLTNQPGSELRLIDFGLSTNRFVDGLHTTYSGTPFYNSPEMFKNKYTSKTDVWSAGVTLYVLVAGYPSEALQDAFNILLDPRRKTLKALPNMPDNMPDSYYEMLDGLLIHNWRNRKTAGEALKDDFVLFHQDLEAEHTDDSTAELTIKHKRQQRIQKTTSMRLSGTVKRHSVFLDFKSFERSLTAVLATMLDRTELHLLIALLDEKIGTEIDQQLRVIKVHALKDLVEHELANSKCMDAIYSLKDAKKYDNFSYHTSLCKIFDNTCGEDPGMIGGGSEKGIQSERPQRVFRRSHSDVEDPFSNSERAPELDRSTSVFL